MTISNVVKNRRLSVGFFSPSKQKPGQYPKLDHGRGQPNP